MALMMLLGALVVLTTGAAPSRALADAPSPPPCHETTTHHAGSESPRPAPGKAMTVMDCCIACVATTPLGSPVRARVSPPRPGTAAPPAALPVGERPAPEPHPPRPGFL